MITVAVALLSMSTPTLSQNKTIAIDGSSTVFPIVEALAEEFQKSTKNTTRVTVGISGTGGGFKKFCRGETDFSNGSRPILKSEIEACKKAGIDFIELPLAYDALTVVVHKNNPLQCVKVSELKYMWSPQSQNVVMRWNQVNKDWPNLPLRLFGAGADSGTFDYFTEAIVGKAKSSRGDYTASEDDNVLVKGVASNVDAIGYFGFAYYHANKDKLKALAIDSENGKGCVYPSFENVLKGTYSPLSRPLFIYVSSKSLDKPEVAQFVEFMVKNASTLIKDVNYLPLPDSAYALGKERFSTREVGTAFGGVSEIGGNIDDILKKKPQM